MDCVKTFYQEFRNNNSTISGAFMGSVFLEVFAYVPMLYPAGYLLRGDSDAGVFLGMGALLLMSALYIRIQPYLAMREKEKAYRIVDKLKYTPYRFEELKGYLKGVLNRCCVCSFIVILLIQVIANLIAKTAVYAGVLYALAVCGGFWFLEYVYILKMIKRK